ncbi:MAG: FHA domain-containing protein [Myxococcota bacterium]
MPRLDHYLTTTRGYTAESFVAEFLYPFLVFHQPDGVASEPWSFNTKALTDSVSSETPVSAPSAAELYEVFPVRKVLGNPWPDRVSVGRARNSDIVLLDPSVSKLHAHFMDGGRAGFSLVDANSRNGTRVNNEMLVANVAQPVVSGQLLAFGAAELMFLSARDFFSFLAEHR